MEVALFSCEQDDDDDDDSLQSESDSSRLRRCLHVRSIGGGSDVEYAMSRCIVVVVVDVMAGDIIPTVSLARQRVAARQLKSGFRMSAMKNGVNPPESLFVKLAPCL